MKKAEILRKVEANEGLTVEEIKEFKNWLNLNSMFMGSMEI